MVAKPGSEARLATEKAWVCTHCGTANDVDRDGDKCGFCNLFRERIRKLYIELAAG